MNRSVVLAMVVILACVPSVRAQPEESRREYATPGLIVETGARRGAADQIRFSDDGQHLLACGDDKVVRVWQWDAQRGLEPAEVPALRWPIWHDNRGNIYAIGLSPDPKNQFVAVAGKGMSTSAVSVIDRFTGNLLHATKGRKKSTEPQGVIWSMAFAPSGKQVAYGDQYGGVWVWNVEKEEPVRLGGHDGPELNFVRLTHYLAADRLLTVAANGQVLEWNLGPNGASKTNRLEFEMKALYRVALSPDGRWLAATSDNNSKWSFVEVRRLDGIKQQVKLPLSGGEYGHSLVFDFNAARPRLAVGIRIVDQKADFFKEIGDAVYLYDFEDKSPIPRKGPRVSYHPEAMAFHPRANQLAIAGGVDHEVTLWNLDDLAKPISEMRGVGTGLWKVGLSADGRYLGYLKEHDPEPKSPNWRGKGDWKVFDLEKRQWASNENLSVTETPSDVGGWKLLTSLPNEKHPSSFVWFVESPQKKVFPLPLDRYFDFQPRCYAFLPSQEGKPARLAVGHYWGASLFALYEDGPVLQRYMGGHEGDVMSLAFSKDQRRLVTCSRDQTIIGFSLDDWPSNPELGARFFVRDGRLFCDTVDSGSPAWEAGLSKGDELHLLAVDRKLVFNRDPNRGGNVGSALEALQALQKPKPGFELYFGWKRPGDDKIIEQSTTVRQRPLWRFFPTRDDEWVLWRWRDYFYDTSTKGDYYIGWQRSYYSLDKTPAFYRAEQFRREFHQPAKVAEMLKNWASNPQAIAFAAIEPPEVKLTPSTLEVKDRDLTVAIGAMPLRSGENHEIIRVLLWINDYLFLEWKGDALRLDQRVILAAPHAVANSLGLLGIPLGGGPWAAAAALINPRKGAFDRDAFPIPRDKLRAGKNYLTLQVYNRGDVRGEARPQVVEYIRKAPSPKLHGLFVGVGDYGKANPPQPDLRAAEDAKAMHELWKGQEGNYYTKLVAGDPLLDEPLLDRAATRSAILKRLEDLAKKVQPDDRLIFYLGGHGTRPEQLSKVFKLPPDQLKGLGTFLYCCADFDQNRLRETTLNFEEIYEALVKLPCRKILLLDACHSGIDQEGIEGNPSNPIRVLTKDGIGPIILAACRPEQVAFEHEIIDLGRTYGLFAAATRLTLQEKFTAADVRPKDGFLDANELVAGVRAEVQRLLVRLRSARILRPEDRQDPIAFVPGQESGLSLATRVPD